MSEDAKTEKFGKDIKGNDWMPTFLNWLWYLSSRYGITLKYVCSNNETPDPMTNRDLMNDYQIIIH